MARDRHLAGAGPVVKQLLHELEDAYICELDSFIKEYRRDLVLRPALAPVLDAAYDYLAWLQWVAWNAANLAPLLGEDLRRPARRLAPAMLAYCGLRLIDDGLDHHETFKDLRPTLVGFLRAERPELADDAATAYSAFLGFCAFAFGVRRIGDQSGPAAVAELLRLFEGLAVGVLAEPLVGGGCDVQTYEHMARRKSVAYNLMLYKPLVEDLEPTLRRKLLEVMSEMDSLAQLVNDAKDARDDRDRRQPNAVVQKLYPHGLRAEVAARLERLWVAALRLPDEYRDALAAMLYNLGTEGLA